MRNKLLYILIVFPFFPLLSVATSLSKGPFSGIDISSLSKENAQIIMEANEDYLLVKNGKKPKNAKFDTKAALPSDGGTTYYRGNGYKLTILKRLSSFGKLRGYIYGPVITFDKKNTLGNSNKIVFLRFYTTLQLKKLLHK